MIRGKSKHSVASQCESECVLFDGQMQKTCVTLLSLTFCQCSPPPQVSVCLCTQSLTTSCLSSPWRKRQLQFLLDGRGRRAGLSPEELRDNGKLLGEGLSRALFNYPSRDCSADSPEVSLGFLLQFIVLNSCQVASDTASSLESDLNVCLSPTLTHICQPKANLASLIRQVTYLFPTIHQSLLLSVWRCYL